MYTKNKEPYWVTDQPNWGLINRSFHYLEPSSCMMRLDSKFDYNSLIDESEKWSIFPQETRLTELTEKYFSKDIDDMFLQYDLVYPSGPAFSSRIDIHSAHIRMDDAYVEATIPYVYSGNPDSCICIGPTVYRFRVPLEDNNPPNDIRLSVSITGKLPLEIRFKFPDVSTAST